MASPTPTRPVVRARQAARVVSTGVDGEESVQAARVGQGERPLARMAIMPGRFHGQERTMRRMLKPLVLLVACVGCTRYEGPLEVRKKDRADAPGYTIPEQRKRANE